MIYTYSQITPKMALKWYLFTFFLGVFFAVFFWSLSDTWTFFYHLVFSLCQGFAILNFGAFANMLFKSAPPTLRLAGIFLFSMTGSAAGKFLAPTLLGEKFLSYPEFMFLFILNMMIIAIIIGFLYYWEGIALTRSRIQEERKKELYMEQKMIHTQLRLLHSRMEPEFLFTILNYILNLLDTRPEKAKAMQMSLIQYLRLSLAKFKNEFHSIAQEVEMIRAYLDILVQPHENRLTCHLQVSQTLRKHMIPTMLLHCLVDRIATRIPVSDTSKILKLTGQLGEDGFRFELSGAGIDHVLSEQAASHLEIINDRLESIYGDNGRLLFARSKAGSPKIILKFPARQASPVPNGTGDPRPFRRIGGPLAAAR